jgi:hypothetical protein
VEQDLDDGGEVGLGQGGVDGAGVLLGVLGVAGAGNAHDVLVDDAAAADFEIPNSGASWRNVRLVRQ